MKTMTIRDIRLKWPEAERQLAKVGEIVVTRDSKPVARILPYVAPPKRRRKRFDPEAHMRWLRRFWKGLPKQPSTEEMIAVDRDE